MLVKHLFMFPDSSGMEIWERIENTAVSWIMLRTDTPNCSE